MSKDRLDRRIQKRFIEWLDAGLLDEIKKLHLPSAQGGCGVSYKRMRELGLAYRFGADLLENKINFTTFINLSVTSIRQYAKRQMTWFKRNNEIKWARNINEIFGLFSNFIT